MGFEAEVFARKDFCLKLGIGNLGLGIEKANKQLQLCLKIRHWGR